MDIGILCLIGGVRGLCSGLLSIGGETIIVSAFMLLLGLPPQHAVGISLAVIIPRALLGVWKHAQTGHVPWMLVLCLAAGAVVGAYGGRCWRSG